jgi:phosphatidylglycerophosphatase A
MKTTKASRPETRAGFAAELIATWFGCGLAPKAPGTFGALGALAVAWPLASFYGWAGWHFAAAAIAVSIPGIWAASQVERASGREDPQRVVVDEVAGQWLTLAALPAGDWYWWLAALLLFRIFDITKPFPVRQLERLPGGLGVIADDLMAGLWASAILAALAYLPHFDMLQ